VGVEWDNGSKQTHLSAQVSASASAETSSNRFRRPILPFSCSIQSLVLSVVALWMFEGMVCSNLDPICSPITSSSEFQLPQHQVNEPFGMSSEHALLEKRIQNSSITRRVRIALFMAMIHRELAGRNVVYQVKRKFPSLVNFPLVEGGERAYFASCPVVGHCAAATASQIILPDTQNKDRWASTMVLAHPEILEHT
jgi:hypothetical protein